MPTQRIAADRGVGKGVSSGMSVWAKEDSGRHQKGLQTHERKLPEAQASGPRTRQRLTPLGYEQSA